MSEYTREEILKMIEEVGGPQNLDLSGKDLSKIDLSKEAIAEELEEYRKNNPDQPPPWCSQETRGIDLHGANLEKANLLDARLEGADLQGAHLEEAILMDVCLEKAFLLDAHLEEACLWGAHLEGACLWNTHLERANLRQARLLGGIHAGAHLEGADLYMAHLEKADLSLATSLAGAHFYGTWLDQTRITKEQLGGSIGEEVDKRYYEAKEAYLLLKNNFNQIGRYDDASWAYVKERQMEKMTYHPKLARTYYAKIEGLPDGASPKSWTWWHFYVKYTLKWLWDWIIWWLCGYGESPGKVVRVAIIVLLAFPLLYWLTSLTPPNGQNILWRDYFLYSLYSFASMEHPTLQATSWIAQLFTGLESLSGIALLALLMYTLGRRISRS
jgi:uncharacterized protein YjbI with pentapeptide repeats